MRTRISERPNHVLTRLGKQTGFFRPLAPLDPRQLPAGKLSDVPPSGEVENQHFATPADPADEEGRLA